MKVITEAMLRCELRTEEPEFYCVPKEKLLSPAAREYLQQRKIKIILEKNKKLSEVKQEDLKNPDQEINSINKEPDIKPRYVDYNTKAFYNEKPEHMTHLYDNVLVVKNHPRILFRGKLDSLQALIVLDQALLQEAGSNLKLINDLAEILSIIREIMRCDVLDETFQNDYILGLTHQELRERSHAPMKYYKIKQMVLPDYTMGKEYALLNQLRTVIRETEIAAAEAFHQESHYTRGDIIEELNRLSSALHIMMCKYLAGDYRLSR